MDISGRIKFIGETQTFGSNGFRKREIAVETSEQYPQTLLIEFVQDKCDILNGYMLEQEVTVGINLRGREWVNPQGETKYFNTLQGWRIESINMSSAEHQTPPVPPADAFEPKDDLTPEEEDLDLPF